MDERLQRAPTSRPSGIVTNGNRTRMLPVAPALLTRQELAQQRSSRGCVWSEGPEAGQSVRGRDGHRWPPPAQIRTSGIPASGSYLECLTAKRTLGQG